MPRERLDLKKTFPLRMRWPLLLALSALALACARKTAVETIPFRPAAARKIPTPKVSSHRLTAPLAMIDRVILEAEVKCENTEECPGNVAMLIVKEKTGLSQCTAFLIDSQTVVTNSHCLPKEMRSQGTSCTDLTAVFPASGASGQTERIACESVRFASEIASDEGSRLALALERRNHPDMDFALLRLKSATTRAPFILNKRGLSPKETLTAWTVDPISDVNPGGWLRKKSCEPVAGSVLAPDFAEKPRGRLAPVGAFTGCQIFHGNSGSPLVGADGQVHALIFATLPARESETQKFNDMSLATNAACIDPQTPSTSPCPAIDPINKAHLQLDRETANQFKKASREWARGAGRALAEVGPLTLTSLDDGDHDLIWNEPRCLKRPLTSRLEVKEAPIWRVRFSVNEVYQPRVAILAQGQMTLSLTPSVQASLLDIERKAVFSEPPQRPQALEETKTINPPLCRSRSDATTHSAD